MHQQPHDAPHKTQPLPPAVPRQSLDSNQGNGTGEEAIVCVCVTGGARGGASRGWACFCGIPWRYGKCSLSNQGS